MKSKNNVKLVVEKKLCTSCGACEGVCPRNAISMQLDHYGTYVPSIDSSKCNKCNICMKVCPGHKFDYQYMMMKIHKKLPDNRGLGPFISTFTGYSQDEAIHRKSQSGGVVSSILCYCLENKIIDGAVVTKWKENDPFKPVVYIAKTRGEVLKAVGSKYNPVPVSRIIKQLIKEDGEYAFVGTSCQIQAMRKAEEIFPKLKNLIKLYMGLHCLGVFTYHYHDQILHKVKLQKKDVSYFRFRDKAWRGWPCDMRIKSKNGEVYNLPGTLSRLWPRSWFTNWRCQLCFDKFNEFSDISCGDCRIPVQYGEKTLEDASYTNLGQSDIIVRTKRGEALFDKIVTNGTLKVKASSIDNLVRTVGVAGKKLGLNTFISVAKIFKSGVPNYGIKFGLAHNIKIIDLLTRPYSFLASCHYYIIYALMKHRIVRFIIKRIPHRILGWHEKWMMRGVFHERHKYEARLTLKIFRSE